MCRNIRLCSFERRNRGRNHVGAAVSSASCRVSTIRPLRPTRRRFYLAVSEVSASARRLLYRCHPLTGARNNREIEAARARSARSCCSDNPLTAGFGGANDYFLSVSASSFSCRSSRGDRVFVDPHHTGAGVQVCQRFLSSVLQVRSFLAADSPRTPCLPGIEDQLQPRHHLFDGGQLPGRPTLRVVRLAAGRPHREGHVFASMPALPCVRLAALALGP